MYKKYVVNGGQALVFRDKGDPESTVSYENLDERLAQQNVVETIEKAIEELEKESRTIKSKKFIPVSTCILLGGAVIITAVAIIFPKINPSIFSESFLDSNPFFQSIWLTPYVPVALIDDIFYYAEFKRKKKGTIGLLNYLKKQIRIDKEKLNQLEKDESIHNYPDNVIAIQKVNNRKAVEEFIKRCGLIYELSSRIEKYYRDYKRGKLSKTLPYGCDPKQIQMAKEHLEETGPTLARRMKNY